MKRVSAHRRHRPVSSPGVACFGSGTGSIQPRTCIDCGIDASPVERHASRNRELECQVRLPESKRRTPVQHRIVTLNPELNESHTQRISKSDDSCTSNPEIRNRELE